MDKTVKLISCENSFKANVIKGRLESEGVSCMLKNENFNFLYGGLLNSSSSGVDVVVLEEDFERAVSILNEPEEDLDVDEEKS
ncbi:MAG: DUF2007 domain-containing protein [Prevotellaceae bacterium]|nr:DUF2007 domain-containing protein [Candidatus Minthosoma equi]